MESNAIISVLKNLRTKKRTGKLNPLLLIILGLGVFISFSISAQEARPEPEEHVFKNQRKNIVILSFGYTYVPKGVALHHHETDGIFVPSIGLDYKRRISEKWALSLFTDWELEQYLVWNKRYDRNRAFIAVLGGSYEVGDGIGLFAGAGREFESSRDLWVLRTGLEYGLHLGKHWVLVTSAFFDWKETYETYSFSLGISRKF